MTAALRAMTAADVPAVMALENETFPEDAWSEQMLRDELAGQPHARHYVVAEEPSGTIVGYAGLAAAGGQGDVQTIAVRADRQGRGVGAALLTELLAEAARRGCAEVFLEVRADNDRARALYERFGFERIGVRKCYYQPSGMDAIVMRCQARESGPAGFVRGNVR
ncbi:ribosomal-protein-alanine N-acetyltransferase [Thermomonospora echinospora]|uniref:Ribosomal-protein-alanine N-acetyltransferase n=1 Tax=Thermomonospora echinospora TaxID=1992 RepID=A0A1H5ZCI2_9ACTN|nr:ribosomal protein S18-alanine N-acetyltransferase [Thermomonospora echinospora]SEG33760.1 ribosomal-protein-alanine N-acetyltransferase [Thermomonospora echinospora]